MSKTKITKKITEKDLSAVATQRQKAILGNLE